MIYHFGDYTLDTVRYELTQNGDPIDVEPQVFSLLACLIEHSDRVVSKDELIEMVWEGRIVSDGSLNSRINSARRAVGDDGTAQAVIKTFPRRGFRFVADLNGDSAAGTPSSKAVSEKPTIAVLPFDNLSNDPEQEYFSDGISEDIITALSRIRWFFVVARNSSFAYKGKSSDVRKVAEELGAQYVLEGSVRKVGKRVRISAQLVDGQSGNHIWAEHFDRDLEDIFAVQDEITAIVASSVSSNVDRAEQLRARARPPENLDAWTAYQKGVYYQGDRTEDSLNKASGFFEQASEFDPSLAVAYASHAENYTLLRALGYEGFDLDHAYELAQRAIDLDSREPKAHLALGFCHFVSGKNQLAIEEYEEAIHLNPSYDHAMHLLGRTLIHSGRPDEALPLLKAAIQLNPQDYSIGIYYAALSLANLLRHDYEGSIEWGRRAVRYPQPRFAHAFLLSALGYAERPDEAKDALAELKRVRPEFDAATLRKNLTATVNEKGVDFLMDGLFKAGLPEE